MLFLAWIIWLSASGHGGPARTGQGADFIGAVSSALLNAERDAIKHQLHYRVRVTPAAAQVADWFLYAQYADHDCRAMLRLARPINKHLEVGPITPDFCRFTLQTDRKNDAHLVRGSRRIIRNCGGIGNGDPLLGSPLSANECFQYTLEGRYVTNSDGSRFHECDGGLVEVFVKQFESRWFVVGEHDTLGWGGGCLGRDIRNWRMRYPWRVE